MGRRLDLPERLEGAALEPLRQSILEMRGADLDLIGTGVERINGLGLQLLLCALNAWRGDGAALRLVDASPSLAGPLADVGLLAEFEGRLS